MYWPGNNNQIHNALLDLPEEGYTQTMSQIMDLIKESILSFYDHGLAWVFILFLNWTRKEKRPVQKEKTCPKRRDKLMGL